MGDTPGTLYAIAIVFSLLAVAATVLRFYARSIKKVGSSWDDYAVIPALVFTIATAIIIVIGTSMGDLGRHTEIGTKEVRGRVFPIPILTHRTKVFQQAVYATGLSQVLTFGFTKLAVLLFYQRIFQGRWIQNAVWFMVGIDFIWTVGFFFSSLLQCNPISINWTGLGNVEGYCIDTNNMMYAQYYSDVMTDVVILALPLPSIWAMQMSIRRKLAVCGIFLLGALTVASGIAKLAIFVNLLHEFDTNPGTDPNNASVLDISYQQTPLVYWPMVESSLGIVGACLPLLRPLFAGAASRGFMRDLREVDIPTSERSETLWDKSGNSGGTAGWDSNASTMRWGSDSLSAGESLREKRLPSLPQASLAMLRDAPSEGPWYKKPVVRVDMV